MPDNLTGDNQLATPVDVAASNPDGMRPARLRV